MAEEGEAKDSGEEQETAPEAEMSPDQADKIEQDLFAQSLAEKRGQLIAPEWKGDIIRYDHTPHSHHEESRPTHHRYASYHAYRQAQQERNSQRPNLPKEPGGEFAKGEARSFWEQVKRFFWGG